MTMCPIRRDSQRYMFPNRLAVKGRGRNREDAESRPEHSPARETRHGAHNRLHQRQGLLGRATTQSLTNAQLATVSSYSDPGDSLDAILIARGRMTRATKLTSGQFPCASS